MDLADDDLLIQRWLHDDPKEKVVSKGIYLVCLQRAYWQYRNPDCTDHYRDEYQNSTEISAKTLRNNNCVVLVKLSSMHACFVGQWRLT